VGEAYKARHDIEELKKYMDVVEDWEKFIKEYKKRYEKSVKDLALFVGLIARIFEYVTKKELEQFYPGTKVVVSTGFRKKYMNPNGEDDFLAANFAFSNAATAEKELHGSYMYLEDSVIKLLSGVKYYKNIIRRASIGYEIKAYNPFQDDEPEEVIQNSKINLLDIEAIKINIFKRPYFFRNLQTFYLSYLQLLPEMIPYFDEEKEVQRKEGIFVITYKNLKAEITRDDIASNKKRIILSVVDISKNIKDNFDSFVMSDEYNDELSDKRKLDRVTRAVQNDGTVIMEAAVKLKTSPTQVIDKISQILQDLKQKDEEIESLKSKLLTKESDNILSGLQKINDINVLIKVLDALSPKELRDYVDKIKEKLESGIIVLVSRNEDKIMLICAVTNDLTKHYNAGKIIKEMSEIVGGRGGGRPDMAQGGGNNPQKLAQALESIKEIIFKLGSG
jgi:hypothetical protein